ncbi:MAG: transposase [Thermus sp.]|uniref:transposase n=1 Tax=Thermus sp. TaxID=275 RepID=UPI00351AC013
MVRRLEEEALTYLEFPNSHPLLCPKGKHVLRHIKSTDVLGRLFREVKRRTKVGVFPNEKSLATVVMLRASEAWASRRYMDMGPLWAAEGEPTKIAT